MRQGDNLRRLLSQNIKQFRIVRGFSQADLSEKANISIPFLSAIECGNKWPSPDKLMSISKALDVEVYDLFKPENSVVCDVRSITNKLIKDITVLLNDSVERISGTQKNSS
jgi:transcriptional regulator with XRE-family HTH domain